MTNADRSSLRGWRICFFNTSRSWGGGEKWAHDFACASRGAGAEVFAVVHAESVLGDRLEARGDVTVHRQPVANLTFLNPLALLRLARFFRQNRIDAVIMALPADLKAGGIAARLAGVREIVFRRGIDLRVRDTALNRLLYGRVITRLICNSGHTLRSVLADNPDLVPPERTAVLYNGFDVAAFDRGSTAPLVERRPGEILLGTAGRLTRQKGQLHLLEAMALLKERDLPVRLLLAGVGELEEDLKRAAHEKGLAEDIVFLGFVEDIRRLHATADIFVFPSLWEGFGYAIVEAMAARRPVVAYDCSSNPEVIANGETGLLCRPGDSADLADKIERLVRDPDLRTRFGEQGRRRVLERFAMERSFRDFAELIANPHRTES